MNIIESLHSGAKNLSPDISDQLGNSQIRQQTTFSKSLRSRGYIFIVLVLMYVVLATIFFFSQREQPLLQLEQYQKIQKTQEALIKADLAAFHVVTVLFSPVTQSESNQVISYFSTLRQQYQNLRLLFPEQTETFRELEQSIPETFQDSDEAYLQKAHLHLAKSKSALEQLMTANQARMTGLIKEYRRQDDSLVIKSMVLGTLGLALIGTITTLFFNRLKSDLLVLQRRAAEIVNGYRGEPLPITRQDELGQLTDGINFMTKALAEREKDLEIERRKSFFKEKMIAIDSLAGGIAHEVGNPITCIAGIAQEIADDTNNQLSEDSKNRLLQLQQYIEGIIRITRDLSMLDIQNSDESEWVDINQQLMKTINLYRYDNRWSTISIETDMDYGLPAIYVSVSQLNQTITHILENAWDALLNQTRPKILLQTKSDQQGGIIIAIEDNGPGVKQDHLENIFEPFYTTKPFGRGTGLGLAICWAVIKLHHGSIRAETSSEGGLKVTINLPCDAPLSDQR